MSSSEAISLLLNSQISSSADNAEVVQAIKATGRKQIVMAGIVTDVCVAFPALSAVQEGYVFAVVDASGTFNQGVRDLVLARMVQAGVQPMNFFSTVCELARDWRNFADGSIFLITRI
ncbi:hypothetical protein K7432_015649 [Basidiobolus ranarum]|uniref:Isochorismatase-like domain-containing protein n=1 Tax=Basidiobolus ranarum TaxID=34480 RepID=A0ABR2WFV4_9FUNG